MWIKILGVVCVGVFVGAALIEAKQIRRGGARKTADQDPEAPAGTRSDGEEGRAVHDDVAP